MRPEDLLVPTPAGLCCQPAASTSIRLRPVERALITHGHSDHARRRPRRGAGDAGNARPDAAALRREFRRHDAGGRLRRDDRRSAASRSRSIRPAMCSARRRSRSRRNGLRIVASGDYKDVADPTCAPFELVPCDVFITEATFGLPVFRHGDPAAEIAKLLRSVALFPERAHLVGAYSLGKAQRVIALIRAGRLRRADLSAWRDGEASPATTARAASISASCGSCARRDKGRARRRHRALPAVGAEGPLDAALSRSGHRLRVGLDAGARARAPARRRTAAGDLRSCRLGRAYRDHRGDRRRRDLGHARRRRTRWCTGAQTRGLKARPLASSATAMRSEERGRRAPRPSA